MLDFSLPDLTPSKDAWRLDWLGEVSYTKTSSRWSQASVRVAITTLYHYFADSAKEGKRIGYHMLQKNVWLPIGVLRALQVGSIWENGVCIEDPAYDLEVFQDIKIGPETVSYTKSGASLDGEYLLPWDSFRWHQSHTHSNGLCIALPGDRRIFIPCMELIRFYFGSSGSLINRLFSGKPASESPSHPCSLLLLKAPGSVSYPALPLPKKHMAADWRAACAESRLGLGGWELTSGYS